MARPPLLPLLLWLTACAWPIQVAAQAEVSGGADVPVEPPAPGPEPPAPEPPVAVSGGADVPAEPPAPGPEPPAPEPPVAVSAPAKPAPAPPPPSPPPPPPPPPAPPAPPPRPRAVMSSLAEAVRTTESEALPALLEALDQAQRAGLGATADLTLADAKAKLRAAADLSLLSEVTSFASASLKNLPAGVKTAMASVDVSIGRIAQAFDLARKAGVAEEELAAAAQVLHQEVGQRLSRASAKAGPGKGRMDLATVEELAQSVSLASKLQSSTEQVTAARRLLEDEVNTELSADMSFVEGMVDMAEATGVKIPPVYHQWTHTLSRLRQVATLAEDKKENLHTFSTVISRAREVELPPGTKELTDVTAKAHACCKKVVGSLVAQAGTNSSIANPPLLDELLTELERARDLGVSQFDLTLAVSAAQNLAKAEMHTALALGREEGPAAKYVIDKAKRAGVSAVEIDGQIAQLTSKAKMKLAAAAAALSNYSATAKQVRELAMEIHHAAHAGGDLAEDLANARAKYTQKLAGPFGPADEDLFEALVGMCDHAGVKPTPELFKQHHALLDVQRASSQNKACSGDEPRKLHVFHQAFQKARDTGLPSFAPVRDVESKVQHCALATLNATGDDIEAKLTHLEIAQDVGVPQLSLASHVAQASLAVRARLRDALAAAPLEASAVSDALNKAGRVGLPQTEVDTAVASLANNTLSRLRRSQARLSYSNGTDVIQELAQAMSVARIPVIEPLLREALTAARTSYEEKMEAAFQSSDVPFAQAAVEGAELAGVRVTGDMHRWVASAKKLRAAVEADIHHPRRLQEILDGAPNTQDKTVLEGRARAQAKAELEEALASGNYDALKAALAAAVQAGVSETTLQSGRAVLNAL